MAKSTRAPVPEPVKRQILLEAGYRCAIPRYMHSTTEIAHIVPYEESEDNSPENLIALCPNHHTMYDYEKKIDRRAMRIIKQKLGIVSGRYNDFEQRVFRYFADHPEISEIQFTDAMENEIQLMNAIKDGYVFKADVIHPSRGSFSSGYMLAVYKITPEGREFIRKWLSEDEELH
jgi:hypothetical protein